MNRLSLLLGVIVLATSAHAQTPAARPTLQDFAWLAGHWRIEEADRLVDESVSFFDAPMTREPRKVLQRRPGGRRLRVSRRGQDDHAQQQRKPVHVRTSPFSHTLQR